MARRRTCIHWARLLFHFTDQPSSICKQERAGDLCAWLLMTEPVLACICSTRPSRRSGDGLPEMSREESGGSLRQRAGNGRGLASVPRHEPVLARPVGRAAKLWRWCRREPLVASLAAAVAASIVLGFAGILAIAATAASGRRRAHAARHRARTSLCRANAAGTRRVPRGQNRRRVGPAPRADPRPGCKRLPRLRVAIPGSPLCQSRQSEDPRRESRGTSRSHSRATPGRLRLARATDSWRLRQAESDASEALGRPPGAVDGLADPRNDGWLVTTSGDERAC